jgi:FlaA1/EpsC-like NDP-sugar epimerase
VERWLNGRLELKQLQKIRVEDLLRRDPIEMNLKIIERGLHDKVIMVTGAAGSIGSEIVRQLTKFRIRKLVLVDNAETSMFHMENELQNSFRHAPVSTMLADVTDQMRMDKIFRENKPEIIFHAAAYKHVPLMEENPNEAVRVNIGSTELLTNLAVKYKVNKFVMVSTDKAVNPTNVMGATKRICEMILRARSLTPGNRTQFVITRFGNVLGSNGSVIPIFRKQIEDGGPVTVTHPEITRYFMTIPEACQLVLEAGFMGLGGEIFVFDMGEPVKILHLARQMITLAGFEPEEDIRIEFTGLRPGEKLYEELLNVQEKLLPTYNSKVMVAHVPDLDHEKVLNRVHNLLYSYMLFSDQELIEKISEMVPEFKSSNVRFRNGNNVRDGKASVTETLSPD